MRAFEFNGQATAIGPGVFALVLPRNCFGAVLMLKNMGGGDATVAVNVGTSTAIKVPVAPASTLAAGTSGAVTIPANFAFLELSLSGVGFVVSGEIEGGGH
ncbi:hypothetical protein [Iodobacter fluviatilis]|uniref:Uncharacterized protein n=1 Tax=Iodobacter fluviatilis TaxID=537 RepID=A0A7G3GCT5_9NEIS|nr:hypothetical protein [Iodobacter fluviatilis]QBC44475.1 hypothetical protein C1H71_13655 [Iodobacter fluviatilis]